jgi:hypothetical protein
MKSYDQKLSFIAGQLDNQGRQSLLSFADFLLSQQQQEIQQNSLQQPRSIERPDDESVIAAMKRLSDTYPMLNKDALLHEAAGYMGEHVMQGRAAKEVIDDLEALFLQHYEAYVQNMRGMMHDSD